MAIQRISLCQPIETRDGTLSKDSKSTNCVFETRGGTQDFVKRPGLVFAAQVTSVSPPATLLSQGLVAFNNDLIAVISNTIYKVNSSTYAVTTVGSTSVSTSNTYFTKDMGETTLMFQNKVNGYLYTSGGALSTVVFPFATGMVCGVVFLDGYMFVATTDNRIYNCDVGAYSTWNALNYISFEQTADSLVGICKHLNYLVAFGKTSIQFYYDAGNATGSPLSIAQSYTSETGCANGDSIVATDNTVLWVGTSKSHGKSVYLMDGVSPVRVSTASIDKCLEASNLVDTTAYCYKFYGHSLYILTLHDTNMTLVYDINEKIWYQWTQYAIASADQPNPGTLQEGYLRAVFYAEANSKPFVLDDDTANLYYFDTNTYQDNGQPIYCRAVTDIKDNGTTHRKFYGRLEIVGDKVGGVMKIRHSGDDYQTWSSYRAVDLSAGRSQTYLGGADRRRAWEFLCTSDVPLRLECAEIDFRIGEMDQEQNMGSRR